MLHARIIIDLPREPLPRTSRIKRLLLSLVTDPGPDEARERLLGNALELLGATLQALATTGVRDVIAIVVGKHAVYTDTEQRLDDLDDAFARVVESGRLEPGFGTVRVVLSHVADGLHTVAELTIDEEVAQGTAPASIELVSRTAELRITADEGPSQYRTRVDALLAEGGLERMRERGSALTRAASTALAAAFGPTSVRVEGPQLRIVAPGPVQVARLRHLGFRQRLRPPTHRPNPTHRGRSPAYDHAHVHYYFDPYHDLLSWIVVEALLDGRAPVEQATVVDPDGKPLFTAGGASAPPKPVALPIARDAVRLEDSAIVIDEAVPAMGLDVAEIGSPHAPGYGGDGYG
ncbi:hypothetical protein [Paraliomyxa miuraensis]|uniref:hypothetical protein n=1 Tax=Paraliomyxa miuraensis TaxID=376150 RepID=UPI002259CB60|nr:hypothetical protein [Paraliomyxa miuraensis]MCX4246841.1 hypothetical protein [Paraliomyxa miuraensis]